MNRSGFSWWFFAISLSLLLHLLLFLELGRMQLLATATAPIEMARVTHVRLALQPSLPKPESKPEPKLETEPEPRVEAIAESESEPMIEPEPTPERKPKQKPKSKPKPAPKLKAKQKPRPRPKTKPKSTQQAKPKSENEPRAATVAQVRPQRQQTAPVAKPQTRDDNAGRERYLATLLNLIEQQKVYPKVARRRGIQGHVQVAFSVACNGTIAGLQTRNGPKILQKSARKAVQKALPLPRPPAENPCPVKVKYAMVFKLN